MNPDTNRFEPLHLDPLDVDDSSPFEVKLNALGKQLEEKGGLEPGTLVRPDGTPVPAHWSTFTVGDEIPIRGYVFRVAYIGETSILFEPVGPIGPETLAP